MAPPFFTVFIPDDSILPEKATTSGDHLGFICIDFTNTYKALYVRVPLLSTLQMLTRLISFKSNNAAVFFPPLLINSGESRTFHLSRLWY